MSRPRRSLAIRDQAASAFSGALMRLCDATAARGAALVDAEGETVDYAGCLEPFEIRVVAAEWRLVLGALAEQVNCSGQMTEICYRGGRRSFVVVAMPDGYALVVELPRSSIRLSRRALAEALRILSAEAGLPYKPPPQYGQEAWTRIDIRWDGQRRRPMAIWLAGDWQPLEVLGRFAEAEAGRRTLGYRARLADGTEVTLVREPMGVWYADEILQATTYIEE